MKTFSTLLSLCLLSSLAACVDADDLDAELALLDEDDDLDAELEEFEFVADAADPNDDDATSLTEGPEGLASGQAQQPPESANLSFQCGPVGYWAQGTAPTPWWDLANCYVTNLPQGAQGFVWANGWYVQPGPGNSCSIGSFDGANCYIGSAPTGTTAFIWAGNLYFTPTALSVIPTGSHKTCIGAGTPAQMTASCESVAAFWTNQYQSGAYDYETMWGVQCPLGSSPVPQTEFFVAGSCQAINYGGQGCAGPGSLNYEFKIGVDCL